MEAGISTVMRIIMAMHTRPSLSLLRLLQLISPSLPVGAYSYSQGLEWIVESGLVSSRATLHQWLAEQLDGAVTLQELPLLKQLYLAHQQGDIDAVDHWSRMVLSFRETSELRSEEIQRGRAMRSILGQLGEPSTDRPAVIVCQLASFAQYCVSENISLELALFGYAYSWLDNQIMAGVKLVPLGQTDGQQILYQLSARLEACVEQALTVPDTEIGYSSPNFSQASSLHETQYCRLFRS